MSTTTPGSDPWRSPPRDDTNPNRVRPGPRRPEGAPAGPDAVRNAVIEAAGHLFAKDGVDAVSLRDIAAAADVQLALIPRYFGSRDDLIETVFADLTTKVAQGLVDRPLQQVSFDPDSAMNRWTALLNHFAVTGKAVPDLERLLQSCPSTREGLRTGIRPRPDRCPAARRAGGRVLTRLARLRGVPDQLGRAQDRQTSNLARRSHRPWRVGSAPHPGHHHPNPLARGRENLAKKSRGRENFRE